MIDEYDKDATIKHLNMLCETLTVSNRILGAENMRITELFNMRLDIISKFLQKKGWSKEDILEFESEVLIDEQLKLEDP